MPTICLGRKAPKGHWLDRIRTIANQKPGDSAEDADGVRLNLLSMLDYIKGQGTIAGFAIHNFRIHQVAFDTPDDFLRHDTVGHRVYATVGILFNDTATRLTEVEFSYHI